MVGLLTTQMKVELGQLFDGRFEILKELGSGFFGTVYLAEDPELKRKVALKVLNLWGTESGTDETLRRFNREAKAVSKLSHPNITRVYRFGLVDNRVPYLAMEFLPGVSLRTFIDQEGNLSCQQVASLGKQIAEGMAYAHSTGIIHRDLKPENVFVVQEGELLTAKILDFGLCRDFGTEAGSMTLTETGALVGTPAYMSPEQCYGKIVDERSDIYAFGCLLYAMVTGEPPFTGDSPTEIICKQVSEPFPDLLSQSPNSGLPEFLQDIILKCCQKDLNKRYQNFDEVTEALADLSKLNSNAHYSRQEAARRGRQKVVRRKTADLSKYLPIILVSSVVSVLLLFVGVMTSEPGRVFVGEQIMLTLPSGQAASAFTSYLGILTNVFGSESALRTGEEVISSKAFFGRNMLERADFIYALSDYYRQRGDNKSSIAMALILFEQLVKESASSFEEGRAVDFAVTKRIDQVANRLCQSTLTKEQMMKVRMILDAKIMANKDKKKQDWTPDFLRVVRPKGGVGASSIMTTRVVGGILSVVKLRQKSLEEDGRPFTIDKGEELVTTYSMLASRIFAQAMVQKGAERESLLRETIGIVDKSLKILDHDAFTLVALSNNRKKHIESHALRGLCYFYLGDKAKARAEVDWSYERARKVDMQLDSAGSLAKLEKVLGVHRPLELIDPDNF